MSNSELVTIFNVLGDKTRYTLFSRMVDECDSCVSELADDLGISAAGTSQQLKVLEKAGMLKRVRRGQKICYEVNSDNPQIEQIIDIIKQSKKESSDE